MLTAAQNEGITAAAYVRAISLILLEKGIVRPDELDAMMRHVRWQIVREPSPRVRLASTRDKYTAAGEVDVDCPSLIPICKGRCCTFAFFLTRQDLDEGVVHEHRPFICRKFDCRKDERIWLDFEKKIPAPPLPAPGDDLVGMAELLLHRTESHDEENRMDRDYL